MMSNLVNDLMTLVDCLVKNVLADISPVIWVQEIEIWHLWQGIV
jgi:hypothetical protein